MASDFSLFSKFDDNTGQAGALLLHLLQHQQIEALSNGSGAVAAHWCAEFIETMAARIEKLSVKG